MFHYILWLNIENAFDIKLHKCKLSLLLNKIQLSSIWLLKPEVITKQKKSSPKVFSCMGHLHVYANYWVIRESTVKFCIVLFHCLSLDVKQSKHWPGRKFWPWLLYPPLPYTYTDLLTHVTHDKNAHIPAGHISSYCHRGHGLDQTCFLGVHILAPGSYQEVLCLYSFASVWMLVVWIIWTILRASSPWFVLACCGGPHRITH